MFGTGAKPPKFGEEVLEAVPSRAWIEAVAWSPSGEIVAFASHDSRVTFVNVALVPHVPLKDQCLRVMLGQGDSFGSVEVSSVSLRGLPLTTLQVRFVISEGSWI